MKDIDKKQCKHKYIVGYSFRIPQPFFSSLPCDNCGCKISLNIAWRIMYTFVYVMGYIVAFGVSTSIQIKFLGSTFWVSFIIFLFIIWIVQLMIGLILKHAKWNDIHI